MSVSAILEGKSKNLITASSGDTIASAAALLAKNRIGAVLVCSATGNVEGILSERDIVRELTKSGASALDGEVSDCMTSDVVSCGSSDTINQLMEVMTVNHIRHMPVIDDGKLVGIVSIGDVVKRKIQQAEQEANDMREYIAS